MKRKAQGAIEYLFMIAAALIIVAIVIRYLRTSGGSTGETISSGQSAITSKLSEELSSALD
ncbi:class III signal peptide-containing protein [Palaeococcus sp. (in: euryarchaeotes)]